ncbi:MAG: hypothetical protein QW228_05980 [Candidatus Aenigmatarchaeota archaeon]
MLDKLIAGVKSFVSNISTQIQKGIGAFETLTGIDIPFVGKTKEEIQEARTKPTISTYQTQTISTTPQTTKQTTQTTQATTQKTSTFTSTSSPFKPQQQTKIETESRFNVGNSVNEYTLALMQKELEKQGSKIDRVEIKQDGTFEIVVKNTQTSLSPSYLQKLYAEKDKESKQLIEKQQNIERFVSYTEREAEKGNVVANIVRHIAPRFTAQDPFGFRTIATFISGKIQGKSDKEIAEKIQQINREALYSIGEMSGVGEGKAKPPTQFIPEFTVKSPVGQLGIAIGASYTVGGAISSFAPALPYGEKIATFLSQPTVSKILWGTGLGVTGLIELGKIEEMREMGIPIEDIVAETGKDVVLAVGSISGFEEGIKSGLPLKYRRYYVTTPEGEEITYWKGLTLEYGQKGKPLIGSTPEGIKLGTPKFSKETIEKIFSESLKSGIIPKSPTETRILIENIGRRMYPDVEYDLITGSIKLRTSTFGKPAPYKGDELPIEDVFKKHGFTEKTGKAIKEWIKKQREALVYGSTGQKPQMGDFMKRKPNDLDIMLKSVEKKTKEVLEIIFSDPNAKKLGIKIEPHKTGVLISTREGHLMDIHSWEIPSYEGSIFDIEYIGYGFKGEPTIKIGGIKTHRLSEQATRKMVSSLTMREGGVFPKEHRVKDIEYLDIEKALGGDPELIHRLAKIWKQKLTPKQIRELLKKRILEDELTLYYSKGIENPLETFSRGVSTSTTSGIKLTLPSEFSPSSKKQEEFSVSISYKPQGSESISTSLPSEFSLSSFASESKSPSTSKPSKPSKTSSYSSSSSYSSYSYSSSSSSPPSKPSKTSSPSPSSSPPSSPPSYSPPYQPSSKPSKISPPSSPPPTSSQNPLTLLVPPIKQGIKTQEKTLKTFKTKERYKPSLSALIFDVESEKLPKEVTGFELVRPLPKIKGKKKDLLEETLGF